MRSGACRLHHDPMKSSVLSSASLQLSGPAFRMSRLLAAALLATVSSLLSAAEPSWPFTWSAIPALPTSGSANRINVSTSSALKTQVESATAGKHIVITANITVPSGTVITYTASGSTGSGRIVLRGNSDSTTPASWPELKDATIVIRGDYFNITQLRLNNCTIVCGSDAATAARYEYNRVSRNWHYGGVADGRDAAIKVMTGCRYLGIDRNRFGAYSGTAMKRSGIIGDQAGAPTELIEDILPPGTTPLTATGAPQAGSIVTPSENQMSRFIDVGWNHFEQLDDTGASGSVMGMFTGQDNGESNCASEWWVHHNLFRNLLGSSRPHIEHKNSSSWFSDNTFERTSTSYPVGHLRLRHGGENVVQRNVFLARGSFVAGDIQVRDENQVVINNRSLKNYDTTPVQGDDKVVLYSGGLRARYWPTRSGQATGDPSFQIASEYCHVGGNRMNVEYGEHYSGTGKEGVPSYGHLIGRDSGTGSSRNYLEGPASGASSPTDWNNLNTTANVTDADYASANTLTPLTTSDVGVVKP